MRSALLLMGSILIAAGSFASAAKQPQVIDPAGQAITASKVHIGGFLGGGVLTTYDDFSMALQGDYALESDRATAYELQGSRPPLTFELSHAALVNQTGSNPPIYFGAAQATVNATDQSVSIATQKMLAPQSFLLENFSGMAQKISSPQPLDAGDPPVEITCHLGNIYINGRGTSFTSMCSAFMVVTCTGGEGMKIVYYQSAHTCD